MEKSLLSGEDGQHRQDEPPRFELLAATQINKVAPAQGLVWVDRGFGIFRRHWGALCLASFCYALLTVSSSFVFYFQFYKVDELIYPLLSVWPLLVCAKKEYPSAVDSLQFNTAHFFRLLALGVISFAHLLLVKEFSDAFPMLAPALPGGGFSHYGEISMFYLLMFFSEALVVLGNEGLIDSLKKSFLGCVKNILPTSIFMIILSGVLVIAMALAVLLRSIGIIGGLLEIFIIVAALSVVMAAWYESYKDIFTEPEIKNEDSGSRA